LTGTRLGWRPIFFFFFFFFQTVAADCTQSKSEKRDPLALRLADHLLRLGAARSANIRLTTGHGVLFPDWVQIIFLYVSATGHEREYLEAGQTELEGVGGVVVGAATCWAARQSPRWKV